MLACLSVIGSIGNVFMISSVMIEDHLKKAGKHFKPFSNSIAVHLFHFFSSFILIDVVFPLIFLREMQLFLPINLNFVLFQSFPFFDKFHKFFAIFH